MWHSTGRQICDLWSHNVRSHHKRKQCSTNWAYIIRCSGRKVCAYYPRKMPPKICPRVVSQVVHWVSGYQEVASVEKGCDEQWEGLLSCMYLTIFSSWMLLFWVFAQILKLPVHSSSNSPVSQSLSSSVSKTSGTNPRRPAISQRGLLFHNLWLIHFASV